MKVGSSGTPEVSVSGSDPHFAAVCHNVIAIGYSLVVIGVGLSITVLLVS